MNGTVESLKGMIDNKAKVILHLVKKFADQNYKKIMDISYVSKQFNELVEASAQASCIDEFKLYIRYKGAKEGSRNLWSSISIPFNATVDELMNDVANVIINEYKAANDNAKDEESIKLAVLNRFCGYLFWRVHADVSEKGGR